MPSPAEDRPFSLSAATWYAIEARISEADSRKERGLASLVRKPDDDKLADIHTQHILGLLAAHAIPALDEIYYPAHLASFLDFLEGIRRWLLCEKLPREAELFRRYGHWESTAAFECQCEMLVNADFNKWRSAAELKISEQARHSQEPIAESPEPQIFRLSRSPSSEPGEYPVNGDIRRVNVPDSAMEEKKHAQAERAKARQAVVGPILEQKRWLIHQWAAASNVNYKTARDYWNGKNTPRNDTRSDLAKSLGISSDRGIFPD